MQRSNSGLSLSVPLLIAPLRSWGAVALVVVRGSIERAGVALDAVPGRFFSRQLSRWVLLWSFGWQSMCVD
jgi:hypothetical protein